MYTRSPLTAGVERGPSPPSLPSAPRSPPPGYLATPVGAAQSSLPVSASSATQSASGAPLTMRGTTVKAFPPPTANELNPPGVGTLQSRRGPPAGHWRDSFATPSPRGPWYPDQSSAAPQQQ